MALQTLTSTTDSLPSAAATTSSVDNHESSSLSPAGSPPLILAILAIGLFSGAMIVLFGWRRVTGRNISFSSGQASTRDHKPTFALADKPKLWELWNADEVTWKQVSGGSPAGAGHHTKWAEMMVSAKYYPLHCQACLIKRSVSLIRLRWMLQPLSARAIPPGGLDSDEKIDSSAGESSTRPASLRTDLLDPSTQLLNNLWEHWRRRPREEPEKDICGLQPPHPTPTTSKTMQVGVVIVLPSAQYPIYVKERTARGYPDEKQARQRKECPDFSLGLHNFNDWE